MSEAIPKELRQLRACLSCSMVKVRVKLACEPNLLENVFKPIKSISQTLEQWEADGCQNCEAFLNLRHNRDNVYDCTSSNFEGMVGACKPDDSWVCKWQRISKFSASLIFVLVVCTPLKICIYPVKAGSSRASMPSRCPARCRNPSSGT